MQPLLGAHHAIGVGADLIALPAQTAAVVVGAMAQMAEVELGTVLGGGELHAELAVRIVYPQSSDFLGALFSANL